MQRGLITLVLCAAVLQAGGGPLGNPIGTATAGAYFARLQGSHAVGLNPANLGKRGTGIMGSSAPQLSVTLGGASVTLGNNTINPTWITDQLFGKLDLRTGGAKEKFLELFDTDDWHARASSEIQIANIAYGNWGLSLPNPSLIGSMVVPIDMVNLLFRGVQFSQPRDLSNFEYAFLRYAPVSLNYGIRVGSTKAGIFDGLYIGGGINYLVGQSVTQFNAEQFFVDSRQDSISLRGRFVNQSNIDPDGFTDASSGRGFSFDLGVSVDINATISASVSVRNLFGTIHWPNFYTSTNDFSFTLAADETVDILADYNSQIDSLKQRFDQPQPTILAAGMTTLPTSLTIAATFAPSQKMIVDVAYHHRAPLDWEQEASNELAIGSEFGRGGMTTFYGGIGFGDPAGTKWGTGFSLAIGSLKWNFGMSQSGGLLKRAEGLALSTNLTFSR